MKWIHALTDENPRHGYRRIAALLKQKRWNVGKRRVRRLRRPERLPTKATYKNHVQTRDYIATPRPGAAP